VSASLFEKGIRSVVIGDGQAWFDLVVRDQRIGIYRQRVVGYTQAPIRVNHAAFAPA
jgi:hypothetical protein